MASTVSEPDNRIVNWYTSKRFRRKVGEEGRNHAFIFAARRRKGGKSFFRIVNGVLAEGEESLLASPVEIYIYIYRYRLNSVKSSGIKRWRALKERGNTMGVYSEPRQAEDTIYFDVFPQRSLRWFFFDVCVSSFLKIKIKNDWCVFILNFVLKNRNDVYWIFCIIERKKGTFLFLIIVKFCFESVYLFEWLKLNIVNLN